MDKSDTVFAKRGGTRYRSASVGLGRCAVWVCSGFRTRDARVCRGLHEDDGVKALVRNRVARLGEGSDDVFVDAPLDLQAPVGREARYSRPSVRNGIAPHLKATGRERERAGGP